MMKIKYQLRAVDLSPIDVIIGENAKEDFIELMNWTEKDWKMYTYKIEE